MTPAINSLKQSKIKYKVHEYNHDPKAESYGDEAAEKLGVSSDQMFKTLVVAISDRELAVAVLPVSKQLDLKLFAKALGIKKVLMADKKLVERITGYVVGGVSPIGQKKRLKTVVDISANNFETIYVSAGQRGMDIELSPQDLLSIVNGQFEVIVK